MSKTNGSLDRTLPQYKNLFIETLGVDGNWSRYQDEDVALNTRSSTTADSIVRPEVEELPSSALPAEELAYGSDIALLLQPDDAILSGHDAPVPKGHLSSNHTDTHPDHVFTDQQLYNFDSTLSADLDPLGAPHFDLLHDNDPFASSGFDDAQLLPGLPENQPDCPHLWVPFTPQYTIMESPFFQLQTAVLATPLRGSFDALSLRDVGADAAREDKTLGLSQTSPKSLVQSLLQDATKILVSNSMPDEVSRLPNPNDVLDTLSSLIPWDMQQGGSGMTDEVANRKSSTDSDFDTPFFSALLYSIANGFAGLRNIPSGAILTMLKKHRHMSSRLIDCLKSCQPAQAKCLADNLFRAAVEACDEEAVILIRQTARHLQIKIDPNEIVCKHGNKDRRYTPIELAAKFRHLGIVNILLAAEADVNKTYDEKSHQEHGALEFAIRKWGKFEPVDITLVRTILQCHAEVRVPLVEAAVRWGQADVLHELFSRFPPAGHRKCFENSTMLVDVCRYLTNDLSMYIIERVLGYCKSEKCMRCSADHQQLMGEILCSAVIRENVKLVDFLLPRTTIKQGGLVAAVRKGNRDLIDLFSVHGATLDGSATYLDQWATSKYGPNFCPPTTPLAEAVRSEDQALILEFETMGALSHLGQKNHFEAVMFAAAEVGDCEYVKKLLNLVPEKRGTHLTPPLIVAIRNNKTEAALLLLHSGADVNEKRSWPGPGPALHEALKTRNRAIVDAILEANVDVNGHTRNHDLETPVMDLAGRWGDIHVIKDLILMGADLNAGRKTTALTAAVKSGNTELVKLLLNSGASPSSRSGFGVTPLTAAIQNGDNDMIQLLLCNGAEVADEGAFSLAIEQDPEVFDTLLEAYSMKYPSKKLGFGGSLLITAVRKGDTALLDRLLAAGFDANSLCHRQGGLMTPVAAAITHAKATDQNMALLRTIIQHGDPNSIVRRPYARGIEKGAPLQTALLVAIDTRSEPIVKLLLEAGADVHRPARRGLKRTPLQRACEIGSFKIVKLLLEYQANVNEAPADRDGATALQLTAVGGSIKIAELLLSQGALVHGAAAKVGGRSALEGAAENGCVEMIRVLWDTVAGTNLGFTPEQINKAKNSALQHGHRGCVDYLNSLLLASH
jgi:ankyrin repeat protein